MPIKIKKPEFKKFDKKYRKWTVITAVIAFALTIMLFIILKKVNDSINIAACIALFCVYVLFALSSAITLKKGIDTYRLENNAAALFQSAIYAAVIIFCLMNLPFALVFLFEGIGKTGAAEKILGTRSYKEFISAQYTSWMCMLGGMTLSMIVGVLGAHKLAKNS